MATLRGTWRFNDTLTLPDGLVFNEGINFSTTTVNGDASCHGFYVSQSTLSYNFIEVASGAHSYTLPCYYEVYNPTDGWTSPDGRFDDNIRTITFTLSGESVSDEFYDWFTVNAEHIYTHTIKAGTYRFADTISNPDIRPDVDTFKQNINFTTSIPVDGVGEVILNCSRIYHDGYGSISYTAISSNLDIGLEFPTTTYVYNTEEGWGNGVYPDTLKTITIPEDTLVSNDFGYWFSNNTYMVSKNGKTGVTIEWDGNTEGLLSIPSPFNPEDTFYQVSDRQFTPEELSEWGYWGSTNVGHYPDWSTYGYIDRDNTTYNEQFPNLYALHDVGVITGDFEYEGMTIPVGVYFTTSVDGTYISKLILPNASEVENVIKSGTYRFNDVLSAGDFGSQKIDFTATTYLDGIGDITFNVDEVFHEASTDNKIGSLAYNVISSVPDMSSAGFNYPVTAFVWDGTDWKYGVYGEGIQTIVIPNDVEVSAEFAEWFDMNAVEQIPMIISGKWKFNDWLSVIPTDNSVLSVSASVNFESNDESYVGMTIINHSSGGSEELKFKKSETEIISVYHTDPTGATLPWKDNGYKTISFVGEQEVMTLFYDWFTANATEVVEESPAATITYNGSTIANLFGGQTATLKCAGMKMESDVVVEVAENGTTEDLEAVLTEQAELIETLKETLANKASGGGTDVTVLPLTITDNGVYDAPYYATDIETWDSNTEYAGSVTVDGITLEFKKAENLIVPDDLNELEADKYTVTCEFGVDGETEVREELLSDNLEITQGVCATYQGYAVIWVKQAAPLNAQFGISFLEDNTAYVTNYLQIMMGAYYGASYCKVSVTAPSKKIDDVAYCPVTVDLPLVDMEFTPTQYGTTRQGYFKKVKINPVPTQTLEVTPLMEDTTYEPEEGKFFSTVTVKGVDASDPSTLHQLCGIYFKVLPKTEYKIGEWPNPSNAVLVVQYTDGTTKEIVDSSQGGEAPINNYIYNFGTAAVGAYQAIVKYTEGGITSQTVFNYTVTE